MLDPRLLRAFATIAETGSFTHAADRLNMTQSTVSQQLARLEETVGRPLIELNGVISFSAPGRGSDNMVVETIKMLRQAEKDSNVKSIVLHIDSPGGEVTAADTIYNEVERINKYKKVVIYMGSLTASGGYYMSPRVREILGYPGQEAVPYDPHAVADYLTDHMLERVARRGPIYRETPAA